ncbi:MAG: chitobiase/beta-hexosaminidase C-terminal domain-containing protein, partial [Muribaculaceae bacterium]|nr:chitobiase/beta-hexosaminidase C-terminal domain-containing protein [Muribaculaceae bacterium]
STSGGGTSPTTVTITSATSGATIYYTTDGTTPTTSSNTYNGAFTCSTVGTVTIKAIAVKSNYSNSEVGQTTVTYNPVLAAPTISPTSNTYDNDLTATITAASGATIYYRVNGGSWQTYSSGVSVTANNTTVEAYASMTNYTDSPIASQTYNLKCALPTLSVGGGTYTAPQTVTITSATDGATIYYSTGSGFNTLANGGSITISESCSLSVYATKANYQDSEFYMTSYTINATPDGSVSNLALAYSPVIGKSANNPTADLIRFDGTVSFTAAPATSNGWTLDKYVVTITDGTHYAQNVSGANFNALVMNADVTTIAAQNFKVGSTYTVSIAARYVKSGEEPYDVTAATSSVNLDEYATYSPSMSVKTFVQPSQEQSVWWGGESHKCYFDVYRVELSINNAEAVSTIPVSYYQLQVSKDNGTTWENVVDRTIDNLLDPSDNPATTYPAISGATSANRFPGNYNFNANKTESPSGEGEISLSFYYAFDVTSSVSPLSVSDSSQDNPGVWRYRLTTVYGAGENVTTAEGTPVTVDASMIQYSDGMSSSSPEVDAINAESPIITGVDGVTVDRNVKEIRFFDMRGVRLNEAPSSGFYIEVKLMNDGSIRTNKRVAR